MYCCLKNKEIKYEIALKYPRSVKYRIISKNTNGWKEEDDISNWVKMKYLQSKWDNYLVYNDEIANNTKTTDGHCKGILSWTNKKIGWLIHSVPKFPEKIGSAIQYEQLQYGQSFIYIEFSIIHLSEIIGQISKMNPNVYIGNNYIDKLSKCNEYKIYPILQNKIYHVSKSEKYEKDIYEDILVREFGDGCFVESWIRGKIIQDSENVKNIKELSGNVEETHDHSKFAVSFGKEKWVFIGDLNRMESQKKRGGGGILIKDDEIHGYFLELVMQKNK
uniref:Uncharacterized protein n=1 Tax=viral metagenome TaxID=1070528 RepID=A0A6C0H549_9ZZZZ